ncbi:TIGR00730 family Rossman fold protein [Flavobacteriaceae bacterium]|nr:TIGR00730 family Rossman fold protein [Flavobacteriaceae bacterium]
MNNSDIKNWNEIKTNDSWSVFKIMGEFVDGYEKMNKIGPCVSIFGSARTDSSNDFYNLTTEIAKDIVKLGFGVITGGGPGVMEAANKGAKLALGSSVGLNIKLPFEQHDNPYIDEDKSLDFDYFFVRKVMFMKYSKGFVVMPGGFGTLDELFEAITLIQTKKSEKFPIILVGSSFWTKCYSWIKDELLTKYEYISKKDLDLISIVDTSKEVIDILSNFYKKKSLRPNF